MHEHRKAVPEIMALKIESFCPCKFAVDASPGASEAAHQPAQ